MNHNEAISTDTELENNSMHMYMYNVHVPVIVMADYEGNSHTIAAIVQEAW